MLCFRKNRVAKKFLDKREGKYQDFLRKFLSHSAGKSRRGTLYSFIFFGCRKGLGERVGGEYQYFTSKISFLTVTKNFVGQTFKVSLIAGIKKIYPAEGYVTIFH